MKKILTGFILSLFLIQNTYGAVPNVFTNGTVADATEINANENYFEGKFSLTSGHAHTGSDSKLLSTLGTITTGTWQGTIVDAIYGGTGIGSYASGDLVYATSDTGLARKARGTLGSLLIASHLTSEPEWLAPGASGLFLKSDGSGANPTWASLGAHQSSSASAGTNLTTTSTSYVDLTSATVTITTGANPVLILFCGVFRNTGVGNITYVAIDIDGVTKFEVRNNADVANYNNIISGLHLETVTAASHTFKIQWKTDAGTSTATDSGKIIVIELK